MQTSLCTRGQVVQHAPNAKLTVRTRPSCATRPQCEIHCAYAAKLCYTLHARPSCTTHGQCEIHRAHTTKLCNTPPMRSSLCACGQVVQHAPNVKFTVHTRPSCATCCTCGQVTDAPIDAIRLARIGVSKLATATPACQFPDRSTIDL
jgi:hypothetical protein